MSTSLVVMCLVSGLKKNRIFKWRILETRDIKVCDISDLHKSTTNKQNLDVIEILQSGSLAKDEQTSRDICILLGEISPQAIIESLFIKRIPTGKMGAASSSQSSGLAQKEGATLLRDFTANFPLIPWLQGGDEQSLLLKSRELLLSDRVAKGQVQVSMVNHRTTKNTVIW